VASGGGRAEHCPPDPLPSVLLDDLTLDQTADLLERPTGWLTGHHTEATRRCARALSLSETDDPTCIAGWADALAAWMPTPPTPANSTQQQRPDRSPQSPIKATFWTKWCKLPATSPPSSDAGRPRTGGTVSA
jgi:hypothetical protein